jgi:monoamine oxidase
MEDKKRIVIIGSGASGLAAARWILDNNSKNENKNNIEVIIFEGRNRIGGRVYSYSSSGTYDLGASWLHENSITNPLSLLCKNLNVRLSTSTNWDIPGVYQAVYYKKNEEKIVQSKRMKNLSDWMDLEEEFCKLTEKSLKLIKENNSSLPFNNFEEMFIYNYKERSNTPLMQAALAGMEFFYGTKLSNLSTLLTCDISDRKMFGLYYDNEFGNNTIERNNKIEAKNEIEIEDECPEPMFLDGFISLFDGLANGDVDLSSKSTWDHKVEPIIIPEENKTKIDIKFNHVVHSITNLENDNQILISYTNDNQSASQSIIADIVICTVPLGVLKSNYIQFFPELSQPKKQAIETCEIGNVVKVVIEFDSIFWNSDNEMIVIVEPDIEDETILNDNKDLLIDFNRGVCNLFWSPCSKTGEPVLITYGLGEGADILDSLSEEQLLQIIKRRIELFTLPNNCYRPPINMIRTSWKSDPMSLGAYSYTGNNINNNN